MAFSKLRLIVSALTTLVVAIPTAAHSQNAAADQQQEQVAREITAMPWIKNGQATIGNVASIEASKHASVLSGPSVARFIELSGNLPEDGATIVAPKDLHWFSIYDYSDVGYVTDKDAVDADALMKSLKDDQEAANGQREQQGLDQLTIVDWAVLPHYDATTHNLEWGLKIRASSGVENINYTTRHLGRGGYVSSVLVSSPETFQKDLAEFRAGDTKLAFDPGSTYGEFRNGDKTAGYGLAALILGGAGAAVVKSGAAKGILAGLLAFWKIIAAGVVAAFAAAAKFFRRLFGRGETE
jgi:uncharacterized membrane-anchored protein